MPPTSKATDTDDESSIIEHRGATPPEDLSIACPRLRAPDNFRSISTCTHLRAVLDSKAKSTVTETYRQAAAIVVAINPFLSSHTTYTQKKDGSVLAASKLAEYKDRVLHCTECQISDFYSVFICLQCPHVGCYAQHARQHAETEGHKFSIDSSNGLLFCFECSNFTNHSDLDDIRTSLAYSTELALSGSAFSNNDTASINGTSDANGTKRTNGTNDTNQHKDINGVPEGFSKPSYQAARGLKGIVNLGSTCFMSCILQTLLHNPLIKYHFFHNDDHFFNCASSYHYANGDDQIDESNACITCSVDSSFKEVFTSPTPEGFGITNLLMTAWYKERSLAGFQEQDAHEFWQFMLNEFHNDHEKINAKMGIDSHPCKCIMHSVFSGELESSVTCGSCGNVAKTVDPLVDLSLELNRLPKNPTLYDCLDNFTHKELLDVKYKCRSCRKESRAHRSLRIKKFPPVLSFQLKRFKHNFAKDTSSKIDDNVDVPLFLNMRKYASDALEENDDEIDSCKVYELFAIVNHTGSVNTGHYIALIKSGSGQWFKFDDSVISLISQHEVKNTNAYLLFYIVHNL